MALTFIDSYLQGLKDSCSRNPYLPDHFLIYCDLNKKEGLKVIPTEEQAREAWKKIRGEIADNIFIVHPFKLKKEETKMKTFSLKDVYEKNPCPNEWELFLPRWAGCYKWAEKFNPNDILLMKSGCPTWYEWLLEKGLIEEAKKPAPKICAGMRIPKGILGGEYIIARSDTDEIVLINLTNGNSWTEKVKVNNTNNITLTEFASMLSHESNRAEEIASKLLPAKVD